MSSVHVHSIAKGWDILKSMWCKTGLVLDVVCRDDDTCNMPHCGRERPEKGTEDREGLRLRQ